MVFLVHCGVVHIFLSCNWTWTWQTKTIDELNMYKKIDQQQQMRIRIWYAFSRFTHSIPDEIHKLILPPFWCLKPNHKMDPTLSSFIFINYSWLSYYTVTYEGNSDVVITPSTRRVDYNRCPTMFCDIPSHSALYRIVSDGSTPVHVCILVHCCVSPLNRETSSFSGFVFFSNLQQSDTCIYIYMHMLIDMCIYIYIWWCIYV